MRQSIDVTVDPKTGMLLLDCPYHLNALVKSLPVRRWNKRKRMWVAPAIWRNIEMLRSVGLFSLDEDATQLMTTVLSAREQSIEHVGFPTEYKPIHDPFQFQIDVLNKSHGLPFGFFMDMGTGKSKVTIDRMTAYFRAGTIDRVFVACLKSARQVWPRELKKHCAEEYSVHLLNTLPQYNHWIEDGKPFKWFIIGVETFSQGSKWETAIDFVRRGPCGFAIDEAHTIMNSTSTRSKRLYDISMSCPRETRSILTGTPITKGPENFFGLFKMLDPEILGFPDPYSFENRYAIKGGFENRMIVAYQNLDELYMLIRANMYQITKLEALPHLPEKLYEIRNIEMSKEQRALYTQMKKDEFYSLDMGTMSTDMILTKMLRLQQIANGYAAVYPDGDISKKVILTKIGKNNPKIQAVLDISEEVSGGMIVWCVYRQELKDIAQALSDRYGPESVRVYHGLDAKMKYTEADRIEAVDAFQDDPECRFFVGTVQSGSLGLTLTFGTTVVYFANTFALNDRKQSEDRAHREGQKNAVTYIDLIMDKSIDSLVLRAVRSKITLAEVVRKALRDNPTDPFAIEYENDAPF